MLLETARLHMTARGAEDNKVSSTHSDQLNRTKGKTRKTSPDVVEPPQKLRYTPEDQEWKQASTSNIPPRTGPPRRSIRNAPPAKPVDQDKVYVQIYAVHCQSHPILQDTYLSTRRTRSGEHY